MAYTTAQVAQLEEMIAKGITSFRDPTGRHLEYQDVDAMRRARREMLAEIDAASASPRKRTYRITQKGTGY